MALQINDSFQINSAVSIDTRIMLTKNEMLNVDENLMPDVYFAICTDGKFYLYNKTNSVDPTTGKFRVLEGSGSAKIDKWVSKKSYKPDDLVVYIIMRFINVKLLITIQFLIKLNGLV